MVYPLRRLADRHQGAARYCAGISGNVEGDQNQLDEFRRLIESGNVGMIEEMQDMMKGGN